MVWINSSKTHNKMATNNVSNTTNTVYFATGNKAKLAEMKYIADYFGFDVEIVSAKEEFGVDYDEKGKTCMDIAARGAKELFRKTGKPIVTEDTILYINALKGPGLMSNSFLKKYRNSGILELMKNKQDRRCFIESCLVYYDGRTLKKFRNKVDGIIGREIRFKEGEPVWVGPSFHEFGGGNNTIYIPHFTIDSNRTLAEATKEEGIVFGYRERNFKQLLDFLVH